MTPSFPTPEIIHLAASPLEWKWRHVLGHQDDTSLLLDRWETLNVEMDGLAKVYWRDTVSRRTPALYELDGSGWSLWTEERKLPNCDRVTLYEHVHKEAIMSHWVDRNRFPADMITRINWAGCKAALKQLGLARRTWVH